MSWYQRVRIHPPRPKYPTGGVVRGDDNNAVLTRITTCAYELPTLDLTRYHHLLKNHP